MTYPLSQFYKRSLLLCFIFMIGVLVFFIYRTAHTTVPGGLFPLPSYLHEISGITFIGNNQIAAVEDETGTIYVYDLVKKSVVQNIPFGAPGDYEDIAAVDAGYYILRSDGVLFEVKDGQLTPHNLGIDAKNNEGLVYDVVEHRLLVATKSKVAAGKEFKDIRYIYAFDVGTKKISNEPVVVIDINAIQEYVDEHAIPLEASEGKKAIKFRPSGIAIHPTTNEIHILSAIDGIIIVVNHEGAIVGVNQLDRQRFNQPEGITFLGNGDMLIANEGGDGNPTLYTIPL